MIAHAAELPDANEGSRRWGRSVGAVFLGILTDFVLSLGTDQVLHVLRVYPPWDQPMYAANLNLLALSYRIVYGVVAGVVTARFAPRAPMRHALVMGAIGFVLSMLGVAAAATKNLGPLWYPIALAISAIPCAWVGASLYLRTGTAARGARPRR